MSSNGKRILLVTLGVVVIAGAAVTSWAFWFRKPRVPASPTPQQAQSFVLSGDFDKLPYNDKIAFVDKLRGNDPRHFGEGLTDEHRRQMFQKVGPYAMQAREDKIARDYLALTTQDERNAYLDKLLDDQMARMERWRERAASRPTSVPASRPGDGSGHAPNRAGGLPGGNSRQAWHKAFIENTPPDVRARIDEFRKAMRARALARGMSGPGGRGGR